MPRPLPAPPGPAPPGVPARALAPRRSPGGRPTSSPAHLPQPRPHLFTAACRLSSHPPGALRHTPAPAPARVPCPPPCSVRPRSPLASQGTPPTPAHAPPGPVPAPAAPLLARRAPRTAPKAAHSDRGGALFRMRWMRRAGAGGGGTEAPALGPQDVGEKVGQCWRSRPRSSSPRPGPTRWGPGDRSLGLRTPASAPGRHPDSPPRGLEQPDPGKWRVRLGVRSFSVSGTSRDGSQDEHQVHLGTSKQTCLSAWPRTHVYF